MKDRWDGGRRADVDNPARVGEGPLHYQLMEGVCASSVVLTCQCDCERKLFRLNGCAEFLFLKRKNKCRFTARSSAST